MEKIATPEIWASQGGLIGLIIMALFVMLGIFLIAQAKIYAMHREDQKQMLDLHAEERAAWSKIVDERQKETNLTIQGITAALNKLASRGRRHEDDE
jgi:hypothetical protein